MSESEESPPQVMWEGRYLRAIRQGRWEYASRTNNVSAVVVLAEIDDKVILVEQMRVPLGRRCLELPAGLVGDIDPSAGIEETAVRELEEETGYTADHVERLGEFHASPGMVTEGFTLVRAHGVRRIGDGGGDDSENIEVHTVARVDMTAFVAGKRAMDVAIDAKLLLLLDF